MKSVKLTGGGRAKQSNVSTSQARANFASALKIVAQSKTIIGFDRYKETVAVLAPIETIYVLAGRAKEIAPDVLDRLERMANLFLHRYPAPQKAAPGPRVKSIAKKAKGAKRAKKKPSGPVRARSKGGR